MPLHGREDGNNVAIWNGRTFLVVHPPVIEGTIGLYEETLLRQWCFCKGIADIGSKYEEVFGRSNSIEES